MSSKKPSITSDSFDAVLFDLDGVLTATAKVHAASWKKTFDDYLQRRAAKTNEPFEPFDLDKDYSLYVDGKPRYDGVKSFLESRGIHLPYGDPRDPPDWETICGIGNRKEEMVLESLKTQGVEVYEGSVAWVHHLRQAGIKTAVVSSSKNCLAVLKAGGIDGLFDVRVDGHVVEDQKLPGKPAPDTYLHAAALLGVPSRRAVVVEDALSGVQAGRNGRFGLVIGVDRKGHAARLWRSLGHHDLQGRFRIDGVTGPDEYSAIADNNVYTNLMAARNLSGAADLCERNQDRARDLGVTPEEMAEWRAAADRIFIPYDQRLGVHPQAEGFTDHQMWNFSNTNPGQYPLMLHFPYFDLYRKQVVKQPDLVLAVQLCGDAFSGEQKVRNFDYYERITVRDSSLSACTQAVLAAEVGHLRLALDYTAEAALMDLHDLEHNARDGLHIASLAGTWIALVNGLGGMRDHAGLLSFAPRLPDGLASMSFSIRRRSSCIRVEVTTSAATYRLTYGAGPLTVLHHGVQLTLNDSTPIEQPIPALAQREPPQQPPGREPQRRSPGGGP